MKKPIFAGPKSIPSSKKPAHDDVARLAHALYEKDGRPQGKHLEHWFNAESMIEANFGYGECHTEPDFSKEAILGRKETFERMAGRKQTTPQKARA